MKSTISLFLLVFDCASCTRIYNNTEAVSKAKSHIIIGAVAPDVTLPPQKNISTEQFE